MLLPSVFPQLFDFWFFAPLLLRVVLGAIFIVHGYPKLFKAESRQQTTGFFASVGIHPALFWVLLVGVVEFFGGIFLILGLLTQIVALLIAIDMIVAMWKVKFKMGFVNGYEFDLILLVVALSLILTGPGAFALDYPF